MKKLETNSPVSELIIADNQNKIIDKVNEIIDFINGQSGSDSSIGPKLNVTLPALIKNGVIITNIGSINPQNLKFICDDPYVGLGVTILVYDHNGSGAGYFGYSNGGLAITVHSENGAIGLSDAPTSLRILEVRYIN